MSEVKRYGFRIGMPERGNVETILSVEDHIGEYVKFEDYENLKAQLEKCEAILKDLSLEHKSEEEIVENTKLTSESGGGNEDDCFMLGYLQADACTALRAREYFKEKESK